MRKEEKMSPKPFDARDNLYRVVESILRGDRQSQELLDAADDALERLKSRRRQIVQSGGE